MQPSESGKVQITVLFWPNVNSGLGHIACVAQEITAEGIGEEMYITPGFASSGKMLPQNYLNYEMSIYESPTVIKIELPASETTYSDFLKQLSYAITDEVGKERDYNFLVNNCAHLVSSVLLTVYKIEPVLNLLPSSVADAACSYLDKVSAEKNNAKQLQVLLKTGPTNKTEFTTGTVSRISKFDFARIMMFVKLEEIDIVIRNANLPSIWGNFRIAKESFMHALDNKLINDDKIAARLEELNEQIGIIGLRLKAYPANFLENLKFWLYEFIRIFSQDPKLENLRKFKTAVGEIEKTFPGIKLQHYSSKF